MLLEELKTFIAVVDHQNFTKAGGALSLAQPTVSLHVKNLEEELKTPLLLRSNKTFQVTPAGKLLYRRAKELLYLAEQTKEEVMWHHRQVSGNLHISASYTIGESVLPKVLTDLHKRYPDLHVEVDITNTEEVEHAVRAFRCDVGCIEGSVKSQGLTITPFLEDELILVTANHHVLAQKNDLNAVDLQAAHWVTREKGSGTREYTDYLLESIGPVKPSRTVFSSNEGIKKAVLCGLGIAAVSKHTVQNELENGMLVQLKADVLQRTRTFSALYSPLLADKRHVAVFLEELMRLGETNENGKHQ